MKTFVLSKSGVIAALFLLGFLAYHNVFSHPFVHDDVVFIVENPHIQEFNLTQIFRQQAIGSSSTGIINTYYRPVLEIVYRSLYLWFGANPAGYHIFNIFLHVLNAILVYFCFKRIRLIADSVALAVAILFLIHPIQTEAVACISGISNLLVALAFFGSFYFFLCREEGVRPTQNLISSLGILFVGLFIKEQMIIFPLLIGIYIFFLGKRTALPKTFAWYMIPVLTYMFIRKFIFKMSLPSIFAHPGELFLRLKTIPKTLLTDMQLLIFPLDLHYYRSVDILAPVLLPTIIFGIICVLFYLMGRTLEKQERRIFWFGLAWFLVTLLPMLNILPLIQEYSLILTFEHFLYIPMIGFILSVGTWTYAKSTDSKVMQWALVIGCGVLFLLTLQQNTYWRGEIPLFERALMYEKSGRLYHLLGKSYYFERRYPEAIHGIKKGIDIFEGYLTKVKKKEARQFYAFYLSDMHYDLGTIYMELQAFTEAEISFRQALALNKENKNALNNLAFTYIQLGKGAEAEALLRPMPYK